MSHHDDRSIAANRPRRKVSLPKAGQIAFEQLEKLDDSKTVDKYEFAQGSFVYFNDYGIDNEYQLIYPILYLESKNKVNGLQQKKSPEWVVIHVDWQLTLQSWKKNVHNPPIAADLPNGGRGIACENEINLIIDKPKLNLDKTTAIVIKCFQHALIRLNNYKSDNTAQKAAIQCLYDAAYGVYLKLGPNAVGRQESKTALPDILIPSLLDHFKQNKQHFKPIKSKHYSWKGSIDDFKQLVPAIYLYYAENTYRYLPVNVEISWIQSRKPCQNLKIAFDCARLDNNNNMIVLSAHNAQQQNQNQ